jgi:DNA primase large subunit
MENLNVNMTMSKNEIERICKEKASIISNPNNRREQMKINALIDLQRPVTTCPEPYYEYTKDGTPYETLSSQITREVYKQLKQEVLLGLREYFTQYDMIMRGQSIIGVTSTSHATFVRDSIGLKPVDESKVSTEFSNPFAALKDDELEALAAYRDSKLLGDKSAVPGDNSIIVAPCEQVRELKPQVVEVKNEETSDTE